MRKILTIVAVVLCLSISVAFSAEQDPPRPNLPPLSEFKLFVSNPNTPCGKLEVYGHNLNGVILVQFIVNESQNPLAVIRETPSTYQVWIDKNMDGVVDEYISNGEVLRARYPTPCDVLK